MGIEILGVLIVIVIASSIILWLIPNRKSQNSRNYVRWDVAPLLGFFGFVLLVLSLAESVRQAILASWGLGVVLGLVVSAAAWFVQGHAPARQEQPVKRARGAAWRAAWRRIQKYGPPVIVLVVGIYIAARMLGTVVEVFVAGALGVLVIAAAMALFTRDTVVSKP